MTRTADQGFSLIELVAAMAIFAVLAVMTQQALVFAVSSETRLGDARDRLAGLQRDVDGLTRDLANAVSWTEEKEGEEQPALILSGQGAHLRFVRGGLANPAALPRSTLVRLDLGFEARAGALERLARDVTGTDHDVPPDRHLLLAGDVTAVAFRAYDADLGWQTVWPLEGREPEDLPAGLEVTLTTRDHGAIRRVVSLQ